MLKTKWLVALLAGAFASIAAVNARNTMASPQGPAVTVDIPTKLDNANVVVDMAHLVFGGDSPNALADINLLANNVHEWNTQGQVIITRLFAGCLFPLTRRIQRDADYEHVNNTGPHPNRQVDAIGSILNFYFLPYKS